MAGSMWRIRLRAPGSRGSSWMASGREMIRAAMRAALMLVTVTVFVFVVAGLLPEDAAQVAAGRHADPSWVSELRVAMGIDQPAWQRFGCWLLGLTRGDKIALVGVGAGCSFFRAVRETA